MIGRYWYLRRCFRAVLFAAVLLCAGCGWQLQGVHHLSADLQPLYIEFFDSHSSFSRALQDRLRMSGVIVTENESDAKAILLITKEDSGHRVISVSATNTPQEYQIYYTVEFALKNHAGELLLQQPLAESNSMTYDQNQALAKEREENMLSEAMAGELADQLLRQIRRL